MEDLPRAGVTGDVKSAPIRQDKIRLVAFLYRKPGLSEEEFSTYWRETHSHVFASIGIVKRNLLKYEQVHAYREGAATIKQSGLTSGDYDGIAIFEGPSLEKILEVFEDPEYKETVIPDEEHFLDRKKTVVFPAQVASIFSDPS